MSKKRVPLSLWMAMLSLIFMSALFLAFVPVAPATLENTVEISGKVQAIKEGGPQDVVIKLSDDPHHYYINRGLEQGLELKDLQKRLEGEEITLRYVKHWSLLNPSGRVRPVAYLSHEGREIFDMMSQ